MEVSRSEWIPIPEFLRIRAPSQYPTENTVEDRLRRNVVECDRIEHLIEAWGLGYHDAALLQLLSGFRMSTTPNLDLQVMQHHLDRLRSAYCEDDA